MERTTTHTPGPWHFDKSGNITTINENAARPLFAPRTFGKFIASVHMDGGSLPVEANARLIAAAPDLLAALEALVDATPLPLHNARQVAAFDQAIEATRRARGED